HAARARRPLARLAAGAATAVLLLAGCTGTGPGPDGEESTKPDGSSPSESSSDGPALEEIGTSAAMGLETDPAEDPAYAEYYSQEIDWGACEDVKAEGAECGTVTVPLAWDDPEAGDIEIAVGRLSATGESTGSLVTNPGGPGGSGVNFLESAEFMISSSVRESYDIVGFD